MNADIHYNEENEPDSITVRDVPGLESVSFGYDGVTAELRKARPMEGEIDVHGTDLAEAMKYVAELPEVDHVVVDGTLEVSEA